MVGEGYINRFNLEGRSYRVIPQVGREFRLDAAMLENDQPLGKGVQEHLVVGHHDHGLVLLEVEVAEHVHYFVSSLRVQVSGGLICQYDRRIVYQGAGNGNTLPLATRAGEVVGVEGDAELVRKGNENARRNGVENVRFHTADLAADPGAAPCGLPHVATASPLR
mgnify:CR=1 FL=1